MKLTKKLVDEHEAWLLKHRLESERNLRRLKGDVRKRADEEFWKQQAALNERLLPERVTATYVPGVGAKRASPQYTGEKMLGTATMHKSNTVPVFNSEEVIDITKMRRG